MFLESFLAFDNVIIDGAGDFERSDLPNLQILVPLVMIFAKEKITWKTVWVALDPPVALDIPYSTLVGFKIMVDFLGLDRNFGNGLDKYCSIIYFKHVMRCLESVLKSAYVLKENPMRPILLGHKIQGVCARRDPMHW